MVLSDSHFIHKHVMYRRKEHEKNSSNVAGNGHGSRMLYRMRKRQEE